MPHLGTRLGTVTVRLDGELEGSTLDHLRELAEVAIAAGAPDVLVDAAGVTYAGSAAIRSLVEVRDLVVRAGGHFALVDPSPTLRRLLEVLGLGTHFA